MVEKEPDSTRLIDTQDRFAALVEVLSAQPVIAVDTESNSFYAYQERVCLIQISVPAANYLLDPLTGLDLAPLGAILANPAIEKVFHDARYDIAGLGRDLGFRLANLFDTMWAARILGWSRVGLAGILEEIFGVHPDKRYQLYNWGQRPLPPKALAYARQDVHYLLPLRARLQRDLERAGRLEEAREVFAQLALTKPAPPAYGPEAFWRVKDVYRLEGRERAVLWELYQWRDEAAQRRDRPPFKVLNDGVLTALARAQPRNPKDLARIRGLPTSVARRYGRALLAAIRRGKTGPVPRPPRHPRPPDEVLQRFEALRAWRQEAAAHRGADPDVILSNALLWALARQNPATPEELEDVKDLGPWKRRTYGPDILRILHPEDAAV